MIRKQLIHHNRSDVVTMQYIKFFLLATLFAISGSSVWAEQAPQLRIDVAGAADAEAWPVRAILFSSEDAGVDKTAKWLQSHLKKLTGVETPINPAGLSINPDTQGVILLGPDAAKRAGALSSAELQGIAYSGFVLRVNGNRVVITGQNVIGTDHAAARFLEQQGCEFYARNASVIPKLSDTTLRLTPLADQPFFDGKRYHALPELRGMPRWAVGDPRPAFTAIDGKDLLDKTIWLDHSAPFLVPKAIYYDTHPEYYALRADGTYAPRETADVRSNICTTHPDVLRISTERMLQWIEAQPERKYFVVMQADDHDWCRCDRCTAMVYEKHNYSDAMLYWVNHVAKAVAQRFPDKILICYAYGPTQPPPVKLRPESNVHVLYAAWPNATSAPCGIRDYDAPPNHIAKREILGWLAVAPDNIGLYEYNSGGRYTLDGMADKVKWAGRHGLRGFWYSGGNLSFRWLFEYVHARLTWDPSEDLETLKNNFINAYYGPAVEPMGRIIHGIYGRLRDDRYVPLMQGKPPAEFYDKAFTQKILADFEEAIGLLKTSDPRLATEVRGDLAIFLENCLSHTKPAGRPIPQEQLEVFAMCLTPYLESQRQSHASDQTRFEQGKIKKAPSYDALVQRLWVWTRVRVDVAETSADGEPRVLTQLRTDPLATLKEQAVTDLTNTTERGWMLPAEAFDGGKLFWNYNWKCESRTGVAIYGSLTDLSTTAGNITLPANADTSKAFTLEIHGQDSDKIWSAAPLIEVVVNGKTVFKDTAPFIKRGWSTLNIDLPAGLLKTGANTVELRNLAATDHLIAAWVMVSDIRIIRSGDAK